MTGEQSSQDTQFRCQECGEVFKTKPGRNIHRGTMHDVPWDDPETLHKLVNEGLDAEEIAEKFEVSTGLIEMRLQKHLDLGTNRDSDPIADQFEPAGVLEYGSRLKEEREPTAVEIIETALEQHQQGQDLEIAFTPFWWGQIPALGTKGQRLDKFEKLVKAAINALVGMATGYGGILLREQAREMFLEEFDYGPDPDPNLRAEPVDAVRVCELALEYRATAGKDDAYDVLRTIPEEKRYRSDASLQTPRAEVEQ